jgi:hypothetical protein
MINFFKLLGCIEKRLRAEESVGECFGLSYGELIHIGRWIKEKEMLQSLYEMEG